MSLEYWPSSEPLHISAKLLLLNRELHTLRPGFAFQVTSSGNEVVGITSSQGELLTIDECAFTDGIAQ